MIFCRHIPAVAFFILAGMGISQGQTVRLPPPDQDGWIKLFRVDNGADWFIANNGGNPPAQSKQNFPNNTYTRSGDTLRVSGNPPGQIYFNQSFSHYRVRYEMRFPGETGNCGMLIHVQQNDATHSGFPVSLESQGDPNQGMGQLWCIGNVWVNVRATDQGSRSYKWRYDPTKEEVVTGGRSWASEEREVDGIDGPRAPAYSAMSAGTGWVLQEADVNGSDSIAHLVNGVVRIKYRDPRVSAGGNANNVTKRLAAGLLGWQAEGRAVWYRNISIKLYPKDPLFATTYTEFNSRNTIRPLAPRKLVLLEDGTLSLRLTQGVWEKSYDLVGKSTRIVPLKSLQVNDQSQSKH